MPAPRSYDRIEVVSFPVPGQQARLLRVVRDPNRAGYAELAEGTALQNCSFLNERDLAPYESDTYKLAKISYNQQTGEHDWYFLNERLNQDAYNFETKYLDEAHTKPVLTRTYVIPRAVYAPLAVDTPDPVVSGLKLVAQEQARSDDPAVDALFVAVTRTYIGLPGVILPGGRYGERNSIPPSFRADLETETTQQKVVPGTAPDTGAGVLESSVSPENNNLAVKQTERMKAGGLPKVQVGYSTNAEGQLVTVTRTLDDGPQTVTPSATVRGQVDPLGGGLSLKEIQEVPEVFAGEVYSKERPDPTPAKFRTTVPTETTEETVVGAATVPTLGAGDLAKTQQQVTAFTKRVTTRRTANVTLPVTLTGKQVVTQFGGNIATTTEELTNSGALPTIDEKTVSAQVTPLGDGRYVKEIVRSDAAWPELDGNEYDEVLGIDAPFTQQVMPVASVPGSGADVTPIDQWKSLVKTLDNAAVRSVLDDYAVEYTSQERVALPDKLLGVQIYWNKAKGDGYMSQITFVGESATASCEASASGVAVPIIEEGYKGSVPASIYVFFLPFNSITTANIISSINTKFNVTVLPWPIIKPESVNVVIKGTSVSLRRTAKAVAVANVRLEGSGGGSVSFSVTRIPPTIHGAITPSGGTSDSETGSITGPYGTNVTATAQLVSGPIPATNPAVFPVGKYLLSSEAAPFRAGYARITALVVDITSAYV
jgi:hypothetical protein